MRKGLSGLVISSLLLLPVEFLNAAQPISTLSKSTPNAKTKSFLQLTQKAYLSIRNSPTGLRSNTLNVNWHISKNFPTDLSSFFQSQLNDSISFYDQLLNSPQQVDIFMQTEKDLKELASYNFPIKEIAEPLSWWSSGHDYNLCSGTFAFFQTLPVNQTPSLTGGILVPSRSNMKLLDAWCRHTLSHELFHAYQDYWLYEGADPSQNPFTAGTDPYDQSELPIFREGGNDTITLARTTSTFNEYLSIFNAHFSKPFKRWSLSKVQSKQDLVKYLQQSESRSKYPQYHDSLYLTGCLFFNFLVEKYGFDRYLLLIKSTSRNRKFSDVIENVYGVPLNQLYSDSSDYLLNAFNYLRMLK